MSVLENLNLYFGGEWENMRDFAKDFKEENEGDEEQAIQSLLMFINALSRNTEEHELLGRKFDALVKATAKVDGQYATLHREWREQNKTIALLQKELKFYANPATHDEVVQKGD